MSFAGLLCSVVVAGVRVMLPSEDEAVLFGKAADSWRGHPRGRAGPSATGKTFCGLTSECRAADNWRGHPRGRAGPLATGKTLCWLTTNAGRQKAGGASAWSRRTLGTVPEGTAGTEADEVSGRAEAGRGAGEPRAQTLRGCEDLGCSGHLPSCITIIVVCPRLRSKGLLNHGHFFYVDAELWGG